MGQVHLHGKDNNIWMPLQEFEAMMELKKTLSIEEQNRMAYFMWNNFSYEGYEEYKKKKDAIQTKEN